MKKLLTLDMDLVFQPPGVFTPPGTAQMDCFFKRQESSLLLEQQQTWFFNRRYFVCLFSLGYKE